MLLFYRNEEKWTAFFFICFCFCFYQRNFRIYFCFFFYCFCFLNLEICFFFLNSSFLKNESLIPPMHLSGNQYLIGPYFMTTIKELLNFYPRGFNALYNSIDATCETIVTLHWTMNQKFINSSDTNQMNEYKLPIVMYAYWDVLL